MAVEIFDAKLKKYGKYKVFKHFFNCLRIVLKDKLRGRSLNQFMIGRHTYLDLHESEWDRLKRKPSPKTINHEREDYIKSLNEQSQSLIKLWPNTFQRQVYQLKIQKIMEHAKHIEKVKKIAEEKKQENSAEAIKRAKDLIFADSCYGRQLTSALLESKTLEERGLQLKFKKTLTESNTLNLKELKGLSLVDSKLMEIDEIRTKLRRDQTAKEVAKCNEAMVKMQKEKRIKENEENKSELEDVRLNNELIKRDAEIEAKMALLEKHAIKEHQIENNKIKDMRAKREERDELKREIWRKYQDRIRYREKNVFNKIHHEKYDTPQNQKVFKTIQNSIENKNKKYDEFVQKGIERWLDRSNKREQKEIENKTYMRNERKLLDEQNKIQVELQNHKRASDDKKKVCYRQCILTKCCDEQKQAGASKKKEGSAPSFLHSKNRRLEDLRARKSEPTPWNGLKAAHKLFSQHASETLAECRYKNPARKVVDDYRRINSLDPKSLPVSNYH